MTFNEYWDRIFETNEELNSLVQSYWHTYSNIGTWQFWFIIVLLLVPLIIVYYAVDRKRIFEIFFFGYTAHILWTYSLFVLTNYNYFTHLYYLTPIFPYGVNMTASALPVGFLLVYQYCTNNKKNFFLYALFIAAFFAFLFATFEEYLGLVEISRGMNKFYLFLIDLAILYISYLFTQLIIKIKATK